MSFIKKNGLGILICTIIAGISTFLAGLNIGSFSLEVIGAPVFAIIFGMIITAIFKSFATDERVKQGITFTSKKILQLAVIILGFSLNIKTVLMVGGQSLPVIISTILTSLLVAYIMCKILKVDKTVATLVGVGSSICGGSAIAATAPVIDADDEEIAQYIKNELSAIYHFSLFRNGKEALQALLGDTHYDIVVSDVIMPEMDGITLLRSIKSNPKTSDLPVILLTSKAEVSDRLEGLKRGADSFLAKPFSIEELQIHIDNLVDNYRRIRGKLSGMQEQGGNVTKPVVEGNDDVLMKRIVKAVNNHLSDPDFTVELLSDEVGLSRAQLHRKMKELTGLTTSEFIRNIRFEQAITLLKEGKINITQVAYAVGYNNQTHFSTVFKRQYGMTPSEYLAKKSNQ